MVAKNPTCRYRGRGGRRGVFTIYYPGYLYPVDQT